MEKLQILLNNKHTSISGLIGFGFGVVAIFWPEYANKCSQAQSLAIAYGLVMAADAGKKEEPK